MRLTGLGFHEEAKKVVSSTLSLYGLGLAVGLGMLPPVAAAALRFYLTRYQPGIGLYILIPALALARGPVSLLRPFFLAQNQERRLIAYGIIGLLSAVVLESLVVAFRGGLIEIALASLKAELDPMSDLHHSAATKRHLATVLARRLLTAAHASRAALTA